MKKQVCFVALLSLLFTGVSHRADAQFWKKIFGSRDKREKKSQPKSRITPKDKPVTPVKKKKEVKYPSTAIKQRYRVDVFVHMYLDELVKDGKPVFKNKIPEKAVGGLDFYEGVKLAADTLSSLDYHIDLYVHDAANPLESPTALIQSKALDSSDLVIGAVNNQFIPVLAGYCKAKKINFVSALSPSDAGVKDNPYFTMLQPSLQAHCEWLKSAIEKKHKNKVPVVLYRNKPVVDSNAFNYLKLTDAGYKKLLCETLQGKDKLKDIFDASSTNIIVVPILDVSYAENILVQLNALFPTYTFEVYGMPSWKNMNALKKPEAFPNIGVNISIPFYYDLSTGIGQAIANNYKKDAGGNKPPDMVFRGYETLYWYAYLLHKYGTVFNDKIADNGAAPFTRFDIKLKWDKDDNLYYLENKKIGIIRYQSSSYIVEQ